MAATRDRLRAPPRQAHYRRAARSERCGLLDRSERGKLALTGAGAVEFLNGQVTNELADLRPGEGRYAAFLTHKGKMLGDLRDPRRRRGRRGPPSNCCSTPSGRRCRRCST